MEGIASVWNYQESIDDLKHKLLYTTIELESTRMNAQEVLRKNEESVQQLLQLLKVACQERDEAKDQLRRLLNKVMMPSSPTGICPVLPMLQPESPHVQPNKANSSITESDSLSESYNHHSYGSSPAESFFDAVSSSDLSNMNMADSSNMGLQNHPFAQESNVSNPMGIVTSGNGVNSLATMSSGSPKIDQASIVIENLVKGKQLPQKGKLLQAVMEAGPLLQTLLVAGPLPRWRNPPPLHPLQIPPVSIKGCDPETINQKPVSIPDYPIQSSVSSSYIDISSQICPTTMPMSSAASVSGSCLNNKAQQLSGSIGWDPLHNQIFPGKRQRLQ
ncbi:PREDICTED: uncharacterized protein LOC104594632 [Nelumbo nucifera]|uniref:Uncharacterized protein LOC104594632 n=1 Tax=Nelumbo nucifera TaxID=4432 RepID=A0A1U7ZJK5_NELNU|nr:PREDICTED: uncharacterized protein LOC104594632 [Nelumbo nucifera]